MSPEQKIFTKLRQICVTLFGADNVYDYLPPEGTKYPFVFIGEQFGQNYRNNKDGIYKHTQVSLHVWHDNPRQRGVLSKMMEQIEIAILSAFGVNGENIQSRVIVDNTTSVPLMHGIIEPNIIIEEID